MKHKKTNFSIKSAIFLAKEWLQSIMRNTKSTKRYEGVEFPSPTDRSRLSVDKGRENKRDEPNRGLLPLLCHEKVNNS